jgi:2'-phosphotransferase
MQLSRSDFKQFTLAQIHEVVDTNDKQRFSINTFDTPDGPMEFIRANQGHSIKTIEVEMTPILSAEEYPIIIHGTNYKAWDLISKDRQGLSRMNRNHIHFATGLLGEDGVISGMRHSCTVLIYLDTAKALDVGVKFFKSENGVVLTEGIDGHLPKEYFSKVVSTKGEVLWPLADAKEK